MSHKCLANLNNPNGQNPTRINENKDKTLLNWNLYFTNMQQLQAVTNYSYLVYAPHIKHKAHTTAPLILYTSEQLLVLRIKIEHFNHQI